MIRMLAHDRKTDPKRMHLQKKGKIIEDRKPDSKGKTKEYKKVPTCLVQIHRKVMCKLKFENSTQVARLASDDTISDNEHLKSD